MSLISEEKRGDATPSATPPLVIDPSQIVPNAVKAAAINATPWCVRVFDRIRQRPGDTRSAVGNIHQSVRRGQLPLWRGVQERQKLNTGIGDVGGER